jgi:AraC family transcriptional regulator
MSSAATRPNDFLADILAHIEGHLFDPLSVTELASVAGLSPWHFSRLFTARFGESVMGYVRRCRLQRAALRLSGDAPPPITTLAFDCGFESQEAFTRAFRRRYGVPPGQFKRDILKQRPPEKTMPPVHARVVQLPDLLHRPAFSVAGVSAIFDSQNKSGIPTLWPRLIACLPLKGQVDARTYGVCRMVDAVEGCMSYMAGVEVTGDAPMPDGFERTEIAAQTYVVFRLTVDGSALHPQMQAAMPKIWGGLLPASGLKPVQAPDFELYPADFEPLRKGAHIDICIPVGA